MENEYCGHIDEREALDKYTASIELSNKCREFYQRRLETAQTAKEKLSPTTSPNKGGKRTSIDIAMQKLREEMSSLMDQDLSLMKQLLMLNETVEELKWRRQCSYESMASSSCELDGSDWSVSDTDMFDSDSDLSTKCTDETRDTDMTSYENQTSTELSCKCNEKKCIKNTHHKVENVIYKSTCLDDQSSCDSGINEPVHDYEVSTLGTTNM